MFTTVASKPVDRENAQPAHKRAPAPLLPDAGSPGRFASRRKAGNSAQPAQYRRQKIPYSWSCRSSISPPARRAGGCIIRLFHIPDEPADIIREMGILFEREQRLSLYNQLRSDSRADNKLPDEAVTELESQHPLHDFSLDTAWNNIIASSNDEKFISEIEKLKEQVEKQKIVGWEDVFSLLKKHNCSIYDILTVASYVLKQDVDYEFHLIDGNALRGWDPTFFAEH